MEAKQLEFAGGHNRNETYGSNKDAFTVVGASKL
jgi:hypothetical protein